jgi:hypothetical protein
MEQKNEQPSHPSSARARSSDTGLESFQGGLTRSHRRRHRLNRRLCRATF